MNILEIPTLKMRRGCVLVSNSTQGLLLDLQAYELHDNTQRSGPPPPRADERLEWSAVAISLHLSLPYIISLENDGIEIHDVVSLASLQKLRLTSSSPAMVPITNAISLSLSDVGGGRLYLYGFGPDQINVFRMIPLAVQIDRFVHSFVRSTDPIRLF